MTRYTYIHVHAYIYYIYTHALIYIYIFIYIIFIYIHSCINISIHVCVNVYTSRFITVQSLFLSSLYCQAAVSPQTFSLLLPESPPHDVLGPQHERPVGPCRDGQDLPLLLGVFGEATLLVAAYFWFELWILQQLQIHSFQVKTHVIFEVFTIYARSKHILDTSNKKSLKSTENKQIAWIESKSSWETCGF